MTFYKSENTIIQLSPLTDSGFIYCSMYSVYSDYVGYYEGDWYVGCDFLYPSTSNELRKLIEAHQTEGWSVAGTKEQIFEDLCEESQETYRILENKFYAEEKKERI